MVNRHFGRQAFAGLFVAFAILCQAASAQQVVCPLARSEYEALKAFYRALGGRSWRRSDNWFENTNPCGEMDGENNWIGIICTDHCDENNERHVEVIALEWNDLSGEIPDELGEFRHLQILNIGTNSISGEVPESVGNLEQLRVFKVSYNKLSGKLPKGMLKLHELELLDLPYNDFVANINDLLEAYPKLRKLNGRGNRGLSGSLLQANKAIKKMTRLQMIDLHWNNIGGFLSPALFALPEIEEIVLSNNDISGPIPKLKAPKLKILTLKDNYLNGTLPKRWSNVTKLTQLNLEKNLMTGSLPHSMGQLTELEELTLFDNAFTGGIPEEIYNLTLVKKFDISNNDFGGTISPLIGQLKNVKTLSIHSALLTGTIPEEIGSLEQLEELHLFNNRFTGTIPSTIGSLSDLKVLDLRTNHLSGAVPTSVGNLRNLKRLQLNHNHLDFLPDSIGDCESLETLLLQNNKFAQPIPEFLGYLENLKRLQLHDNKFTGDRLPSTYGNLQELEELTAHDNLLPGNPFPQMDSSGPNPYNEHNVCHDLSNHTTGKPYYSLFKVCGTRNDFYVDVLLTDPNHKWLETHGGNFHTCYGKCRPSAEYALHSDYQKTSRYMDMYEVANKGRFAAHVLLMRDRFGEPFNIHPLTYRMPFEYNQWRAEDARHPGGHWLLKPTISCCGQNIRLVEGADDPTFPTDLGNWIIQRFVHPPHLINGHKYVLRLFAIVTSFSPLRLYMFPDGDVFYTHANYTLDKDKVAKSRGYFISDYFFTRKQREMYTTSLHLFNHFREMGLDTDVMWKRVQDVAIKALIATEMRMHQQFNQHDQRRNTVYEVVGYDILFDENLKPWVCEVNTTPNLGLEINKANDPVIHEEDFDLKTRLMRDTLAITGIIETPKNNPNYSRTSTEVCRSIVDQKLAEMKIGVNASLYCHDMNDFSCLTAEDIEILYDFECEYQRRGEFEILFPGDDADEYLQYFPVPRRENHLQAWWHKLRDHDPKTANDPLPWSRAITRDIRESKSDEEWVNHQMTPNQPCLKWNTDEEGRPPKVDEDRYILDDADQFPEEEFPEDAEFNSYKRHRTTDDDADEPAETDPTTEDDGWGDDSMDEELEKNAAKYEEAVKKGTDEEIVMEVN